jgi:hypothetical protein
MKGNLTFAASSILFLAILLLGLAHLYPCLEEEKRRQQVLSATVMITITTPNWQEEAFAGESLPIPNDEYRTIARADGKIVTDGLGTLVVEGNELLLVTHDHWSCLDDALGMVTFRAAGGSWLADMELDNFKEHIRYRDGGMIVVSAPDVLKAVIPVECAALKANTLHTGERAYVVQRAGDPPTGSMPSKPFDVRIVLTEVRVIAQAEKQGRPIVRLRSVDQRLLRSRNVGDGDDGKHGDWCAALDR